MWDVKKAVAHLNSHAENHSLGKCARYVREAVEAGGVTLIHHISAKDYGRGGRKDISSLERVMFKAQATEPAVFMAGDVAVIQPIPGHPHGHMTMFNGKIWVSDFRQYHGLYPGKSYRDLKPAFTIYRHFTIVSTPALIHTPVEFAAAYRTSFV